MVQEIVHSVPRTFHFRGLYLFVLDIAMPRIVNKAKIACLDFSLQKAKMHLGVSVVIDDPEKLAAIRERWALYRITPLSWLDVGLSPP